MGLFTFAKDARASLRLGERERSVRQHAHQNAAATAVVAAVLTATTHE